MSRHSEDVDLVLLSTSSIISKNATTGVETALDVNELTALNNIAAADLAKIDGITNGTAAAGKALVLGSSGEIATITTATITTGNIATVNATNVDAGASGTAGTVDVFPATASKGKLTLSCADQTGNTAVTLNANAMGQATQVNLADPGAAASYVAQSTAALTLAEVDVLDAVTAGTVAASKAVVVDANKDISEFRNVGLAGALTFGAGGTLVSDHGTATSTAAAATVSKMSGIITTEALTTAANTDYTFTLTNTLVTANSNLLVTVGFGTATAGHPNVRKVTPGAGSAVIIIHNDDVAAALNGTIIIQFFLVKP